MIHSIQTEKEQREWLEQHVSREAVDRLYNKSPEAMESLDREYVEWTREVKRLAGRPVGDPEVQELIGRQMKMNLDFVGTEDIAEFAELAAMDEASFAGIASGTLSSFSPDEEAWLQEVIEYYVQENGFKLPGQD